MLQEVILVNEDDRAIGSMEKMEAHQKGLLHRAFSVFIFNNKGEMLLQQRALNKYHSAGLWSNACCSHPFPDEDVQSAAERRLSEEMGIKTPVQKIFDFLYRSSFDNGLTEYEFDHVFIGTNESAFNVNTCEVNDFCFKSMADIASSLQTHPAKYTTWFHIAFPKVKLWMDEHAKEGMKCEV